MATNRITINGTTIQVQGNDVRVSQGSIYVDGVCLQSELSGAVHIYWHGDLAHLQADGIVECRDVEGSINAGGSVFCRNIEGSVTAGGSVHSRGNGDIHAGGSVYSRGRRGNIHAGGSVHLD